MIYLAAVALMISLVGFYQRTRSRGLLSTSLDTLAAAVLGWVAGLLIGIGARIGMWTIPFFNGTDPRITFDGTIQVVLVFSLFGIGLGIVYEFFFRGLLRNRGIVYGLLITVLSVYPLASAALQQLSFTPAPAPLLLFSFVFVGLMFLPFAVLLEQLLSRWHKFRGEDLSLLRSLHSR